MERISKAFPDLDANDVREVLARGLRTQKAYENIDTPLGFPVVNGNEIQPAHIVQFDLPRETVRTIELFTDGYFDLPNESELSSWESRFREIEEADPYKVGLFQSTKGSGDRQLADDRTVVIVKT